MISIYIDTAEDFGVDWVNQPLAKTLTAGTQGRAILNDGDSWVTVDPYHW